MNGKRVIIYRGSKNVCSPSPSHPLTTKIQGSNNVISWKFLGIMRKKYELLKTLVITHTYICIYIQIFL